MKISNGLTALALTAFAAGLVGAALVPGNASAATENCKTVTQNMVRPDSGVGGHVWATDTFVRTVKVCVETPAAVSKELVAVDTATFKVVGSDKGTLKTQGVKSPQGNAMLPGIDGTFTGEFTGTYTAPYDPANPTAWPYWAPSGGNGDSTTPWVLKLWSQGAKGDLDTWGWNYATCNEAWKNAKGGNSGDITGLSVKDASKCVVVTYKVQCDGKVDVTIVNKLVAGIKVKVNGSEKTLVLGTNTFTGVTTTEGWLKVEYLGKELFKVRCIKPTTCPSATPSVTPSATPTVVPTTPAATVSVPPTSIPPVQAVAGGGGNLAVTPGPSSNPVPWLAGSGVALVFLGVGMLFLIRRNRAQLALETGDDSDGNDTLTFDRIA